MNATTTILITNKCPLNCRYCNLAETMEDSIKKGIHDPTYEEIDEIVYNFIEKYKNANSRKVTFSGGEPFLRWPDIKKIIEKYGDKCTFDFNTSGYPLTEEIIEWLSNYSVTFNLSVDGGEKVTNYLRPLRNPNSTAPTYWEKLKSIAPTLLYYFPTVYCKIIISKRLVKNFYHSYLELEQLGFKRMYIILDITERSNGEDKEDLWTDNDYLELSEQLAKIATQRAIGMKYGIERLEIIQMEEIIHSLLNPRPLSPYNLVCEILEGRSVNSMFAENVSKADACYSSLGFTPEEFDRYLNKSLEECNGKCPNDNDCPFFIHCSMRTCPKDNIEIRGNPYKPEFAFCKMTKALGEAAVHFLNLCNKNCPESLHYRKYLGRRINSAGPYIAKLLPNGRTDNE